ncbi:FAD-dependent oxidoreductase [Microlunatus ginsengisoli]|uniref:NAD(P)-binding protein n=1 Tax=Microlunatus ginsengisoli TaxID=363863 RepID=A0ABP6ZTY8_9ACTN
MTVPDKPPTSPEVAVIGASFAGLFAAAAANRAGARVVLLERDALSEDTTERPGVPQGGQPHVLLHRGLEAIEGLLPGLRDELVAAGGVPIDSGDMAWLSPDGWLPTGPGLQEFVSLSRPLLELLVRRRVLALPGVELRTQARVHGLAPADGRWRLRLADGPELAADTVIDAAGRSSRLPHWLADLGIEVPEPTTIEAKLGYATRRYRSRGARPLDVGILIGATPESETGALALPVENDEWLICGAGFGARRPSRDSAEFQGYLRALCDPAVADLAAMLEPVGDVRIHRQTGNRRHGYDKARNWPAGLLVVGDALTAFNPVYGQGITVAACQAELLTPRLRTPLDARTTARVQARLARVADLPWSIATGQDVLYPSCEQDQTAAQRLMYRWTQRVNRLAAGGDASCRRTLNSVYHLMAPGTALFRPRIVGTVLRSLVAGVPAAAARPAVLDAVVPAESVSESTGPGSFPSVNPPPTP